MEKCFDYLGCKQTDCIMFGKPDDVKCWQLEGTLCNNEALEIASKAHKDKCDYCIYKKVATCQFSPD